MKQFLRLFGALALVLALSAPALAVDVRISGSWDFTLQKGDYDGADGSSSDFWARQRVRTYMDFIVSEALKGTLAFEIGETNWGNLGENDAAGQGFSMGGDGVSIEVKRAYIDWLVPNTMLQVRMGLQGIALPAAVANSPVLDDDMAGISLAYQFNEMFAANAFWARLWDGTMGDGFSWGGPATESDNIDAFGLVLPITANGFNITPYGMYVMGGSQAISSAFAGWPLTDSFDAWWVGVAATITALDPFVFKFDGIYGGADFGVVDTDGFFVAAAIDYKMDSFTPGIFAFYGSGADNDEQGWMPVVSPSGFGPTSFATDGAFGIDKGAILTNNGVGLWGVGIQLADISFIESLSHVIRVAYYQGTNDKDSVLGREINGGDFIGLADDDQAWEINLDSYWNIYGDNLIAALELGYIGLDLSNHTKNLIASDPDGVWRVAVAMQYNF